MASNILYVDPNEIVIIGLDEEEEGNVLNDERAQKDVSEALVRNIMFYGILQPVNVRQEAGRYFVVDGRQRVKAAREAARRQQSAGEVQVKVPCLIRQSDDMTVAGIMVSSNEIRSADAVLVKAKKAARLLSMHGDIQAVALTFGRSVKTVENWMLLVQAAPEIHQAIETGKISANVGIDIARKPREEQIEALNQILADVPGRRTEAPGEGTPVPPRSPRAPSGNSHPGLKKGWLRKAMKSDAGQALDEEHLAVLQWFLTGHCLAGTWMYDFCEEAEQLIGE
jgi:ParB family transcriptional regulator, chromosome partitioning protein